MLPALALNSAPPQAARGGDDPRAGQKVRAVDPASESGFAAEIRRTLKNQHDRMIDLANQLVGTADGPEDLEGQLAIQQTRIESANASLQSAALTREVAEMALNEYEQGIFVQKKAATEAELKLAGSDLDRAQRQIQIAKDRLALTSNQAAGSTSDIAIGFRFSDQVVIAELEAKKAGFAVEQAKSKLKVFLEFTKLQRVKELNSAVEKAKSDELAKRATWSLEQAKLKRLQREIDGRAPGARERKARDLLEREALVSLDRAIPIDEQIRTRLEQLTKSGKPDDPLRKEIQELTNQLQALVDQAEIERSAARFDKLKTRIHAAANR